MSHRRSKSLGDLGTLPTEYLSESPATPPTPKSLKSAKFSMSPKLGLKPVYLLGRKSWYNLRGKFKQEEAERGFELISSSAQFADPSANHLPLLMNHSTSTCVGSSTSRVRLEPSPILLDEVGTGPESRSSLGIAEESDRESAFSYEGPYRQLSMHFYKRQSTLYDYDSDYDVDNYSYEYDYDDLHSSFEDEDDLSHLEDPANGFYQHSNLNNFGLPQRVSYDDLIDEVCQVPPEDDSDYPRTLSRSRSDFLPRDRNIAAHRRHSLVIRGPDRVVTLFSPLNSPARGPSVKSNRTTLTPITETAL